MTEVRRRPGGRSARVRAAVLDATTEVLLARGLADFRIAAVAAVAGVHETSIYRRWGSRENLLAEALLHASEQHLPVPDTGRLRDDLLAYAAALARFLATPVGRALDQVLALGDDGPAMHDARERFWTERAAGSMRMITRAVERGELPDSVDPRLAIEMLVGPVHFRLLLVREPVDARTLTRLVDTLLHGIAGSASA
ncbi:TetR-like C-terminal domain-containing protein [Actinomycetospora termitidis]|uniref:TetR-like C-terminal domain-containing protein n=1 Tax=Actinomycetospora termitidis TaxID=3053470 RepID=A0ABT7M698_9PSEU|nr:TetR-like C-terminal domain-containing protein [Actinomycetospora sp. Odt1-22]MDL5156205.1 TetR-like C-terminal domain-containing protein [Actinomycetospora sp. Odt1-22]